MAQETFRFGYRWWAKPALYTLIPVVLIAPGTAARAVKWIVGKGLYLK